MILTFRQRGRMYLQIIGDDTIDGIPKDEQQFYGTVHVVYPLWDAFLDEISRRLLDGDLVRVRPWHLLPIPFDAFGIVVVVFEEVHLLFLGLVRRMKVE